MSVNTSWLSRILTGCLCWIFEIRYPHILCL